MKKNIVGRFRVDSRKFWVDFSMLKKDWHRPESTQFQSEPTLSKKIEKYIFRISAWASSMSIQADSPTNQADSSANGVDSVHKDSNNG